MGVQAHPGSRARRGGAAVSAPASQGVAQLTSSADEPESVTSEGASLEPTEAEIEAWAERERERRQRWLSGPTPEQAAVAMIRARERREPEPDRAYDTWDAEFD